MDTFPIIQKKWILENVENKKELEAIISFRSTIPMQISFLEKFVSYHYVKVHDARFTLTQSQMQTLIENVYQGKYLFVQKNTIAKPLADLTKNTEMQMLSWEECWKEFLTVHHLELFPLQEDLRIMQFQENVKPNFWYQKQMQLV